MHMERNYWNCDYSKLKNAGPAIVKAEILAKMLQYYKLIFTWKINLNWNIKY